MKKTGLLLLLLAGITCSQAFAERIIIETLHRVNMDNCRHVTPCDEERFSACEGAMRFAFAQCDGILAEDINLINTWSDCVTRILQNKLGKDTVLKFALLPKCEEAESPPLQGGGMPQAAEIPVFFTAMSLDMKSPSFESTPEGACVAGAARQMQIQKEQDPDVVLDIGISGTQEMHPVGGDGETSYRYLLNKPVHSYGKCSGKAKTLFLRRKYGYPKGHELKADYHPDIYVVIDCKSRPKPSICY